jgi:hypothetical protein
VGRCAEGGRRPAGERRPMKPFPQGVHSGAGGEAVMVRIEVGSGCERQNATKRADHDDRQNDPEGPG